MNRRPREALASIPRGLTHAAGVTPRAQAPIVLTFQKGALSPFSDWCEVRGILSGRESVGACGRACTSGGNDLSATLPITSDAISIALRALAGGVARVRGECSSSRLCAINGGRLKPPFSFGVLYARCVDTRLEQLKMLRRGAGQPKTPCRFYIFVVRSTARPGIRRVLPSRPARTSSSDEVGLAR